MDMLSIQLDEDGDDERNELNEGHPGHQPVVPSRDLSEAGAGEDGD